MKIRLITIFLLLIIVAAFVAGVVLYPRLPAYVASHWNSAGQVNGYMTKFWGVFLLPIIMLGLLGLWAVIPLIDPLKANIKSFRKYYDGFWVLMELFMLYVFALTMAFNLGYNFSFTYALVPAMAVLWFVLGTFLKKLQPNWFVGIRTPWTLSSKIVWEKTHRLGGILFQISAIIIIVHLFLSPSFAIGSVVIGGVGSALIAVVYSYILYAKIKRNERNSHL